MKKKIMQVLPQQLWVNLLANIAGKKKKKAKQNRTGGGYQRFFRYAFIFAGILLTTGCSDDNDKPSVERLIVYDWSMTDRPEFHSKFLEKYPDVPPRFTYLAEDAEAYGKIKAGFVFDIVHPCSQFFTLYAENGLIQPLDTSRIKRWDELAPSLVEAGKINGVQYFMPYDWGYESIMVRTDKVASPPDSWADLWDPQYKGHVVLLDSADAAYVVTSLVLGLDPWKTTPAHNEQILEKLKKLKPRVFSYWTDFTEIKQMIMSGDAWVSANVWNDAYVDLQAEGIPVKYITPEEGMIGWTCGYAISSSTSNLDMAYDYLNALLDPQSQAAFGDMYAYGVSSKRALALMDQDLVKSMQLDDPDVQKKTVLYKSWTEKQRKIVTEIWNKVKTAP